MDGNGPPVTRYLTTSRKEADYAIDVEKIAVRDCGVHGGYGVGIQR
jgi:hypothetical protein